MFFLRRIFLRPELPAVPFFIGYPRIMLGGRGGSGISERELHAPDGRLTLPLLGIFPSPLSLVADSSAVFEIGTVATWAICSILVICSPS